MEALANKLSWKNVERWFVSAEGKRFLTCIIVTFVWGLVAHAYAFLNPTFSHDSMWIYANAAEEDWKVQLGRIFVPVYRQLFRGGISAPWLIGCLSMLWIGIACYLVCRIFEIKSFRGIAFVAGIMTANHTVTTLMGTYIHDGDCDMLALLAAVLSAYMWYSHKGWGSLRWVPALRQLRWASTKAIFR